jgi:hypothetical protein
MKLYKTRVRLGGSLLNEVWVPDATAAELHVLARIHRGGDNFPLAEVVEIGAVRRTDDREWARLRLKYLDWNLGNGESLLKEVLGAPGAPLPQAYTPPVAQTYEEFDDSVPEEPEVEEITMLEKPVDVIRPVRTKVPRGGLRKENVVEAS